MTNPMKELELLAPAGNHEIAVQAILHGADAIYMGATSHGARKNASNSIDDIKKTVEFAHIYRAKVYVTVNTIIYESEIQQVERLINSLYRIGVDAIIVQDMSILRMDIPPIPLHASTQCDIRTPQKAKFLQDVGFSQLVLPRELTLKEIHDISNKVDIPLEFFVHGALCVSYSGRCHASYATCGRSANRGECAQVCRLPFTLSDSEGRTICKDRHLLSLRDLNTIDLLPSMVAAGISSFKIEGRLKEAAYVKNTVAAYRKAIDRIISLKPNQLKRSSYGYSEVNFTPNLSKSFNRGFTHYFLENRKAKDIYSPDTPKSLGETIADVSSLNNGDGISFKNTKGEYTGVMVNGIEGNSIIPSRPVLIPKGAQIHRTYDRIWEKNMLRDTASRKIKVSFNLDNSGISAVDERGCMVRLPLACTRDVAKKIPDFSNIFGKLGNTPYVMQEFISHIDPSVFIPAAELTELRREIIKELDQANKTTYPYLMRRNEDKNVKYVTETIDFRDNVANSIAEKFYKEHGVTVINKAIEAAKTIRKKNTRLMTTRHCILRELGMCKKEKGLGKYSEPLTISSGKDKFRLEFNCRECEMHLIG